MKRGAISVLLKMTDILFLRRSVYIEYATSIRWLIHFPLD